MERGTVLDISGEELVIHSSELTNQGWRLLWSWRNLLADCLWPKDMSEDDIIARLRLIASTPIEPVPPVELDSVEA